MLILWRGHAIKISNTQTLELKMTEGMTKEYVEDWRKIGEEVRSTVFS